MWSEKEVGVDHLRVYKCKDWSVVETHKQRQKLNQKSKKCVWIPDGVKGYTLWNRANDEFLVSRDVIFDKNTFPFKEEADIEMIDPANHQDVGELPTLADVAIHLRRSERIAARCQFQKKCCVSKRRETR
ncbi:hypothetical protein CBL_20021 [Carabus blaptoides fortunei]